MTKKEVVAFIPARGGSKGIPNKNIKLFMGKPLIAWSILQALESKNIDNVYVSSDSKEILSIASDYGARTITRPDNLSGDTATTESAISHFLNQLPLPELVILLQATSPLRKPHDLDNAILQFRKEQWDSGFSGAELEDFLIWRKKGTSYESINYDYHNRGRRQDREIEYVENGSIYLFKPSLITKNNNRMGGKIGIYCMDFWQSFELDQPQDWALLETLYTTYLTT